MKRIKLYTYLILFIIYYVTRFLPEYNRNIILVKHFSLFLFLALVSYDLVTRFTNKLLNKHQLRGSKETIVYIGRTITFAGLIITISMIQINYVKFQYIKPTLGCEYYDQYNNLIYISEYEYSCPDLTITMNTPETLSFTVTETHQSNYFKRIKINENDYIVDNNLITNFKIDTAITIQYDEQKRLDTIQYEEMNQMHSISNNNNYYSYTVHHKNIKNLYHNSSFEQYVSKATQFFPYELNQSTSPNVSFEPEDFVETYFYTLEDYSTSEEQAYQIMKDYTKDGEPITEVIANITYSNQENEDIYTITLDVDDKIIISLKDHETMYTTTEAHPNKDQRDYIYKSYSGYDQLLSFYERNFDHYMYFSEDDRRLINTHDKTRYEIVPMIDGNKYLVPIVEESNMSYYDIEMMYHIEPTNYGKRVSSKFLTKQSYFNYLLQGERKLLNTFFKFSQDSKDLFELEHQLDTHSQAGQLFYDDKPYLIKYE